MEPIESFLQPKCRGDAVDSYVHRQAILRELMAVLPKLSGDLLDIGCGQKPYASLVCAPPSRVSGYIGMDFKESTYGKPDLCWDGKVIPLSDNIVECAMATEVLEHCPDPAQVLKEAMRVLKPGGVFFFTVPFLWPLHCVPHDEYRFTPFVLERLFRDAGFKGVHIRALGGWDASLAQMIGLWVCRRRMPSWKRALLIRLASKCIPFFLRRDVLPARFEEGSMVTGLCGTAIK